MTTAIRYRTIVSGISFWLALTAADMTLRVSVPWMFDGARSADFTRFGKLLSLPA
jgi:hypothetical protein